MLAIDPGQNPGFALFDEGELAECGNTYLENHRHEARVVCERPMIYPHSKANPNNIITLAITAGKLVEICSQNVYVVVKWYEPRQWKGQLPKTKKLADYVVYKRVLKALNVEEKEELADTLARVSAAAAFDVVDAVGIGLHDLGRL